MLYYIGTCFKEDGELAKKVPKKKPPRVEDTRSKKEHVNVVFIGHVGECRILVLFLK